MNRKALFAEVDYAVGEALQSRPSKLNSIDVDEWTAEDLQEDAREVTSTIAKVCEQYGWTSNDYDAMVRRVLVRNRHTPKHLAF